MKITFYRGKEILTGLGFILFSLLVYNEINGGREDVMMFPKFIAMMSSILGIGVILSSLKAKGDTAGAKRMNFQLREVGLILMILLILAAVNFIGFYPALFLIILLSFTTGITNEKKISLKQVWLNILYSCITTVSLYLFFNQLLKINTPSGIFF